MMKFCPECGFNLKENFNFCPSCGADLKQLSSSDLQKPEVVPPSGEMLICDNCGGEVEQGSTVCEHCGIQLTGNEVVKQSVSDRKPVAGKQAKPKHEKIKSVQHQQVSKGKELEMKKVWTVLGVVAGVGLIILYAAGVFDKPSSMQQTGFTQQPQDQGSGVNLANLELINELEAKYKANPDDNATLLQLAHIRQDSGFYEQAISNYQEYLAKIPDNADARIDMGVCYYNLGRYDDAIREMTKALEYSPDHQIGHLNLGIVNLAANNIAESKEWFQMAVDINPDSDIGKRAQELLRTH